MKILMMFITTLFLGAFALGSPTQASVWKVVPNEEVCMVTDMHFTRPQIPVAKDGKTYYGCCENCKATIENDAKSRTAIDPHSKKSVDKAKAIIAANASGSVLYFQSKSNFDKYVAKIASNPK